MFKEDDYDYPRVVDSYKDAVDILQKFDSLINKRYYSFHKEEYYGFVIFAMKLYIQTYELDNETFFQDTSHIQEDIDTMINLILSDKVNKYDLRDLTEYIKGALDAIECEKQIDGKLSSLSDNGRDAFLNIIHNHIKYYIE